MIHIIILSLWLSLMAIAWYLAFLTLQIHYRPNRSMQPRQYRTQYRAYQHKHEKVLSKPNFNKSDCAEVWLKLVSCYAA